MNRQLYGLVLVGGESRRMGRDKALLSYDGRSTQLEHTAALINSVCAKTFISLREEQSFAIPAYTGALYDSVDEAKGPLCGILSAIAAHPNEDWLVVACDLPFLKVEALQKLADSFHADTPQLTAYRSTHDGFPEPLCAIYPAGIGEKLRARARSLGKFCPRKLLIVEGARLIDQDDPRSLDNINTSEEYRAIFNQYDR